MCFPDIRTETLEKLCLVHSKVPTAIEATIAVCFSSLSFEHTPYHAAAFINISPLKCGGYSRAALIRGSRLIE